MGELPISLSLDAHTAEGLKREAKLQHEDINVVAEKAIKLYVDRLDAERGMLRDLAAEADKGEFISSEAMLRWMRELEDNPDAPPPDPDILPHK